MRKDVRNELLLRKDHKTEVRSIRACQAAWQHITSVQSHVI